MTPSLARDTEIKQTLENDTCTPECTEGITEPVSQLHITNIYREFTTHSTRLSFIYHFIGKKDIEGLKNLLTIPQLLKL